MADNGLIITIGGDAKKFDETIDGIKEKTSNLESQLATIAKISGVAFTALVGSASLALKAYGESEKASKDLVLSLQNQGIASDKLVTQYKNLAAQIQIKTGIDDDQIIAGQAVLQGFLGQTEISKDLGFALADLSEKTGSVTSAAEILGRGVQGNVKGLKQFGIVIDENLTKEERLIAITEQVTQKFGGLAAASNQGVGSVKGLRAAFGDFLENVGERIAPIFTEVVGVLTLFFQNLNANKPLLDFIFETGKIAFILTGVVTGLATTAITIIKVQQAFAIAQAAVTAFGLASKIAVGATGLGLILIIGIEIYANWSKIFPAMQAIFHTFTTNIGKIGDALGDILSAVFNPFSAAGKFKSGFDKLKAIAVEGFAAIAATGEKSREGEISSKIVQDDKKRLLAIKSNADLAEQEALRKEILIASNELIKLNNEQASEELIALKKQQIEDLKSIQATHDQTVIESLDEHLATIAVKRDAAQLEQREKDRILKEEILANDENFRNLSKEGQEKYFLENKKRLELGIVTEEGTTKAATDRALQFNTQKNNKFLQDRQEHGTVVATLNQTVNSREIQGAETTISKLTALATSKNATLKAIGKASAIASITINTAKGAIEAYTGFLAAIPFPPVSIPLGIAAAAAIVAFGAEQISQVTAAADGGVIPGFNRGGDSVHSFLQPGELVVPRSNFNEVVNATANQRLAQSPAVSSGLSGAGGTSAVALSIQFSGDSAEKFLTARQVESRSLGTLREAAA